MHIIRFLISGILTFTLLISISSAEAAVDTGTIKDKNLDMSYPIVYLDNNPHAQDKINSDIADYVYKFRNDYNQGRFYSGKYIYELKYEDDNFLSIMLIEMRYMYGAAHTWDSGRCITYDKSTGDKIPLPYFVKLASDDLDFILTLPIRAENDKVIPHEHTNVKIYKSSKHAKISTDYYLLGNGGIALVYPPYALAPYSYGFTHIDLKADMIDYLNRKNP